MVTNRILQPTIKILSLIIILVAILVSVFFFKADYVAILTFIVFIIFFMLLPGDYLLQNIGISSNHTSTRLARGFFAGFALNIILYYLSALLHIHCLLFAVSPIASIMWIVRKSRFGIRGKCRRVVAVIVSTPASFYVFITSVFLFSMLMTQYDYIDPRHSTFSLIKQDFGYHAGIINALAEGYPPKNPWLDGRIISYHFFTEMLLSIPVRVLHLTSDKLIMSCTPYFISPIFSISLYSFFKEINSKGKMAGFYCLAFQFSDMFILKAYPTSALSYHIYSNVNNTGIGLSCLLVTLPLLKKWHTTTDNSLKIEGKYKGEHLFFFALMVMLMTGVKGPISVIFVAGVIGTLILAVILKKANAVLSSVTLLTLISFITIYIYVLGGEHSNASGGAVLNVGEISDIFYLKSTIMDSLGSIGLPRSVVLLAVLLALIAMYFTAFIVPFTVGYIREFILIVKKRKDFEFSSVCIYACFTVGFISLFILNFSGHSQIYFGLTSSVMVPVIAFRFFEDVQANKGSCVKFVRICFAILICIFSVSTITYMANLTKKSCNIYRTSGIHLEKYRNISAQEYEGLIWIRDNTEKDSLCASDRFNSVSMDEYDYTKRNNNTHFSYAIYSQRRQYIEGSGFSLDASQVDIRKEHLDNNSKLFDPSNDTRGNDARKLGVNYIIVSKRFNDPEDLSNNDYALCFSNDQMDIYKVIYP